MSSSSRKYRRSLSTTSDCVARSEESRGGHERLRDCNLDLKTKMPHNCLYRVIQWIQWITLVAITNNQPLFVQQHICDILFKMSYNVRNVASLVVIINGSIINDITPPSSFVMCFDSCPSSMIHNSSSFTR